MSKTPQYVETFADGTVFERPWTPEELAQQAKDRDDFAAAQAAADAAAEAGPQKTAEELQEELTRTAAALKTANREAAERRRKLNADLANGRCLPFARRPCRGAQGIARSSGWVGSSRVGTCRERLDRAGRVGSGQAGPGRAEPSPPNRSRAERSRPRRWPGPTEPGPARRAGAEPSQAWAEARHGEPTWR